MPRPDQNYKVASFFHIANCHVSVMGRRTGIDGTSRRKSISPGGEIKKRLRGGISNDGIHFRVLAFWKIGKANELAAREGGGRGLMWCHAPSRLLPPFFEAGNLSSSPPSLARVFWVRFAELLLRSAAAAAAADYWKNHGNSILR